MDRDAAESVVEVVPPFEWLLVRKIGLVGQGLVAGAAALGLVATALDSPPAILSTARLALVFVGSVTVGAALSMRADLWKAWGFAAVTAALGVAGLPEHWDSFRLLFSVMAAVATVWALLLVGPARYRLPVLSAALVFHFSGIFSATTTPPPTPWVTEQAFIRVYNPYLQFVYLRNAYHFYSPEPGPASLIICMLKTETGTDEQGRKQYKTQWVALPKRPDDVKDPLGLTYYRRLSITEQLARVSPGLLLPSNLAEKTELLPRRQAVEYLIPVSPNEERLSQYRLPNPEIARFVLPSYASHVILEHTTKDEAAKTTVKIYRVEHRTMGVEEFVNSRDRPGVNTSPYHPTTYRPFFLGEFDVFGTLLYPQEPLLYWLVPIVPREGGAVPGDPNRRDFIDFMSVHALFNVVETGERGERGQPVEFGERHVDNPKYRDRVFDWNQLR